LISLGAVGRENRGRRQVPIETTPDRKRMSMADDSTLRSNRSNDAFRRGSAADGADAQPRSSDPLAELARLIGQTDPFAELAASNPRQQAEASAAADWRGRATPVAAAPRAQTPTADPRGLPPSSSYQRRDPHQMVSGDERSAQPDREELQDTPPFAGPYNAAPTRTRSGAADLGEESAFLAEGEPMGPDDDEIYDDPPPARWRGGVTALVIIVCATVGSAAAYAYRSYSTTVRETQAPPVITAERAPTKVIPANDPQSGKNITDRVGDQGLNERMVSREEQPVELRNMIAAAQPRVVLQSAPSIQQAPAGTPGSPGPVGSVPPQPSITQPNGATPAISEPKRVRTLTIRPDAADLSGRPVGSIAALPQQPRPATPPSTRGGDPISLDPQTSEPPATRERPPIAAAPPTRIATAPTNSNVNGNGASSGYMVQISSQKTDAEAQASIRALQAKYPHLLNAKPPHVSRADLGAKGVFYRAVVGPFASSSEANSFCSGLKAAGGQCVIQRN
jgi:hypothetical protein